MKEANKAYEEYLYDADPGTDGRAHTSGAGGKPEPKGGWPESKKEQKDG